MKKVILLDDDCRQIQSLSLWFQNVFEDCIIYPCFNLDEARKVLNKENIDLIISDYNLGDLQKGTELFSDGYDLTCPVIFLTGHGTKDVIKEIANKHVFAIFEKNVDLLELEATVSEAFNIRKQTLEKEKINFLGQSSATLLHEINNPLTIILGKIELLRMTLEKKMPNFDQEVSINKNLQSIEDASYRLINLMKRTKNVINGNNDFDLKNLSFKTFLNQFIEDSNESISRENITLKVDIEKDFNLTFDTMSFYQIFGNLISNSIDAFNEKGIKENRVVTISSQEGSSGFKYITFEDNGPGIPQDKRDKVFEKMYTTKTGANGTGLGLHVCREIIQSHMGELYLDKDSNSAKFIMKLPVK